VVEAFSEVALGLLLALGQRLDRRLGALEPLQHLALEAPLEQLLQHPLSEHLPLVDLSLENRQKEEALRHLASHHLRLPLPLTPLLPANRCSQTTWK
jgi:hypothetical protein